MVPYNPKGMAQAPSEDFTFVAAGDFGCSSNMNTDGYEKSSEVLAKMAEQSPELVLGLGHYSYQSTMQCWHDDLEQFPSLHSAMHNPAFKPIALGEHETVCDGGSNSSSSSSSGNPQSDAECEAHFNATGRADFLDHFGINEGLTYYSFDYKGVHFIALDTNIDYGLDSAQYYFAQSDLEAASEDPSTKWIVAFFHNPMYRSNCDSCGDEVADISFRNVYQPLFDRTRVDLVLAGKVNAYERFKPLVYSNTTSQSALSDQITDFGYNSYTDPRGQIHATVGTGGRPVVPWSGLAPEAASRVGQTYGFLKIDVSNSENKITGTFIDKDASPGVVQDSFTVTHTPKHSDVEYYQIDGEGEVSNRLSVANTPALQLTQFSAAAWFQTNYDYSQPGNDKKRMILNKGGFNGDGTGADMNYGIWIENGPGSGGKVGAGFEAQNIAPALKDSFVSSDLKYNDGRWHYAVVTKDGTTLTLYIDGVPASGDNAVRDVAGKVPDNTGLRPFKIGYNSGLTNDLASAFHGNIDEVRVWNRSLTAQEVWAAYGGNVNTAGQVIYKPGSRPTANAGPDQSVIESSPVTLSGLGSADSDGTIVSYYWTQTGGPAVTLSSAGALQPSFTAPPVGAAGANLTFALTVTDNEGLTSISNDSVQVAVSNSPDAAPIAIAGSDLSVGEGDTVFLNGTASFDPEGQPLTYFWVQTFGPQVKLENPTSANARFLVPEFNSKQMPVSMAFLLTVNDGQETSRDTVTVTITDTLFSTTGDQYLDIEAHTEGLQLKDPFSVATWIRTTADTSSLEWKTPVVNKGGFGTDAEGHNINYGIWFDCGASEINPDCHGGNRIEAGFESSNGTDVFVESPVDIAYNTGKWYFAVVTFDGYKLKLFVNAVQVDGKTTPLQPDSGSVTPVRLGANSLYEPGGVYQPQYFTGDIDDVRVWDRALSRDEVAIMYATGGSEDAGLVVHDDLNSRDRDNGSG